MELKDRINNIKTILLYCSRCGNVEIVSEEVGTFFANLFNNDDRFQHTDYERVFPKIFLSESLNKDCKTNSTTIGIEYIYDCDSDGYYTAEYYFNDEDLEDTLLGKAGVNIEYSEVPDNIWAIIQDELYENALKTVQNDLISATKEVDRCTNKLLEFNRLQLK